MNPLGSFKLTGKKETAPVREVHSSLIVANIVSRKAKSDGQALSVLDLGPARGGNVDFYSTLSSRIQIADLFQTITARKYAGSDEIPFSEILNYESTTRFDIIFLWDIANYLSPSQIAALGEQLEQYCHAGTTLYALVSSAPSMAKQPGKYQIAQDTKLWAEYSREEEVKSPRYSKTDFKKLLPSFERIRSYLLRNGMEEYLFRFKGEETSVSIPSQAWQGEAPQVDLEALPLIPGK